MLRKKTATANAALLGSASQVHDSKSKFFHRQISGESPASSVDPNVEKSYKERMRSLAKTFLCALFKGNDLKGAQESAQRLIGSARIADYAMTVEFVEESLHKYNGIVGIANRTKPAFPEIELLSLMRLAERKAAAKERPKAVARALEWVLDR